MREPALKTYCYGRRRAYSCLRLIKHTPRGALNT